MRRYRVSFVQRESLLRAFILFAFALSACGPPSIESPIVSGGTTDSASTLDDLSGTADSATTTDIFDGILDLSPASWPAGELQRFWNIAANASGPKEVTAGQAMIAATLGPVAIRAGLEALSQGGSAADAAITTALAQIVIAAGSWISFAGRMTVVYYDASTGSVHALNANYNVPLAENDPLSIPSEPTPSGRTTLVPGFMAGIESLHQRFGRLDWKSVFTPAVYLAEEGFVLQADVGNLIQWRQGVLSRLPETRAVFTRADGQFYRTGDLFRQPALAVTLRRVAEDGADYMYGGEWGRKLIDVLTREGGVMTMEDLRRYRVNWHTPASTQFGPFSIHGLRPPNLGGPFAVEIFSVIEQSNIAQEHGSYVQSPDALYGLMQISMIPWMLRTNTGRQLLSTHLPNVSVGPADIAPDAAAEIWNLMQSPAWPGIRNQMGYGSAPATTEHSDAIIAVDVEGNAIAVLHTINALAWGTTGIFVDGVSIPNSAAFQQTWVRDAGAGGRVRDAGPPTVVLRDGRPVFAASAAGGENISVTWEVIYNVLALGMNPQEAVDQPNFFIRTVREGDFPQSTIDGVEALGQRVIVVGADGSGNANGFLAGISVDPVDGSLHSGIVRGNNGIALGF